MIGYLDAHRLQNFVNLSLQVAGCSLQLAVPSSCFLQVALKLILRQTTDTASACPTTQPFFLHYISPSSHITPSSFIMSILVSESA